MKLPRLKWIIMLAACTAILLLAAAAPAFASNPNAGCNQTPYENPSGNGANHSGAYDDTCDGSASGNGNGDGNATGKPCAGCVGKADEKNPPGQAPDGTDANNGYECDGNSGIAKTNPAHTGCASVGGTTVTPPPATKPPSTVLGKVLTLPTTGAPVAAFLVSGILSLATGVSLRVRGRREITQTN